MKVFKNREELKWHLHKLLCKGDSNAEYFMNRIFDKDITYEWEVNKLVDHLNVKIEEL